MAVDGGGRWLGSEGEVVVKGSCVNGGGGGGGGVSYCVVGWAQVNP